VVAAPSQNGIVVLLGASARGRMFPGASSDLSVKAGTAFDAASSITPSCALICRPDIQAGMQRGGRLVGRVAFPYTLLAGISMSARRPGLCASTSHSREIQAETIRGGRTSVHWTATCINDS
jgi:hypothetical protein